MIEVNGILAGKTALVTGASRGIGRAIAEYFAASGAFVVGTYANNAAAAQDAVAAIESRGGKIIMVQAEFGTPDAIDNLVRALDAALDQQFGDGGLDILINNAGGGDYGSVETTTEAMYDETFEKNTKAPFFLTKALLPRLRSGGSVINLSSEATRIHLVGLAAYSMAKVAVENFTIALAKEIGPRGIRVNAIRPGVIRTAQSEDFVSIPEKRKEIEELTALGRIGHVDDIAGFVHAIVGPAGGFVTGQVIEISGGYLL